MHPTRLRDLDDHDLDLVGLPFCLPGGLLPTLVGTVPPTNALLILMMIGAAVCAAGLGTVLRGERSTSPS